MRNITEAGLDKPVTNEIQPTAGRVELIRRDVHGECGYEAVMFLLSLPPGGSAPAHKHPGLGVGYVLEGVYESQYEGEDLKRFYAGDAIDDMAETPHLIARNGSDSEPLQFVMTFVVRKGEPTVLPL